MATNVTVPRSLTGSGALVTPVTRNFSCDEADLNTPIASHFIESLNTEYMVFLCISSILTMAIVVNFLVQITYVVIYVSDYGKITKLAWMAGLYPQLILRYFSRTLFVFVDYVIDCFGGQEKMSILLKDNQVKLNTPPCCCCCNCLPTMIATRRSVRILAMLTYQNAIVRPLTFYINAVIMVDQLGQRNVVVSVTDSLLY
ncbi:unnamed protein product [Soboliphyme baturini]|uniref:Organic solute transporter alpha-like protein n=1 Tax=Soboliphyme baturini TaxID=241478 RepID=A0A183IGG1_9BILA|nr:unnamed protein product [Soboliphyme baturini]